MKKVMCCILIMVTLVVCTSCNHDNTPVDEGVYNFETDHQLNMNPAVYYYLTETKDGVYFLSNDYLYFMDDGVTPTIMCNRIDCLHTDTVINVEECNAYIGFGSGGIYYYNGSLYILATNSKYERCIMKYSLQGDYVKTVATVPESTGIMIQHRGYFYYQYYDVPKDADEEAWGVATLERISADGKDREIIFQNEYEQGLIDNISAYGNYVYFRSTGITEEGSKKCTYIYDITAGGMSELRDVASVYIVGNNLLFNKAGAEREERKTVYSASLDGSQQKDTGLRLKYASNLWYAYEDFIIETNNIELNRYTKDNGTFTQRFIVYKNNEYLFEFSFDNVEGYDWSHTLTSNIFYTDEHMYFISATGEGQALVVVDRYEFENGVFKPKIIDMF